MYHMAAIVITLRSDNYTYKLNDIVEKLSLSALAGTRL